MSDLCTQENKVCLMRKIAFWSGSYTYEKMKCVCPKEHSYECGSQYCASESDACHAFTSENTNFARAQLGSCQKQRFYWK